MHESQRQRQKKKKQGNEKGNEKGRRHPNHSMIEAKAINCSL
jgi:hypothetical protein